MREPFDQPLTNSNKESYKISYVDKEYFKVGWHKHSEVELMLVVEGEGTRYVGDSTEEYGPGDLVLVGANLSHHWKSSDRHHNDNAPFRAKAFVIQFREDCFGKDFFEKPEMEPIQALLQRAGRGIHFTEETSKLVARKIVKAKKRQGIRRLLTLLDILHDLAYSKEETQLSTLEYKEPVRSDNRLGEVFVYIEKYYLNNKEPLGLDDLAVVANMSRATLGRHFKTVTSQNVVDFINNKRVRKASELLITTSLGVDEIGRKCGFGSYANFNDQFKEIAGYSPREYRNRHPSRKE